MVEIKPGIELKNRFFPSGRRWKMGLPSKEQNVQECDATEA
jgi:hypothetical protein